jgi:menaquinol-cytochrome c reductase iron-sulfur subunit
MTPAPSPLSRRGLLAAVTGAAAVVVGLLAAIPGLRFLLHPLTSATGGRAPGGGDGGGEPVLAAAPDAVRLGHPILVALRGPRRDGWVTEPKQKLGAAWLLRTPEGRVRAFSNVCPHLGCAVDWNAREERFACPCHGSAFDPDGRCVAGPSPRGLDELHVVASESELRVRFQRFRLGTHDKEPIG